MDPKIRIKFGSIEIEYEGNESYLKNELPNLIDKLISLKTGIIFEEEDNETTSIPVKESKASTESQSNIQMSANSIAAKLGAKSVSDLILVACAHLSFVQLKDTFHRSDILTEMKTASNYYKNTHSKNLSQGLKSLITSHRIIERTKDTFALSASEKTAIKTKLNVQ